MSGRQHLVPRMRLGVIDPTVLGGWGVEPTGKGTLAAAFIFELIISFHCSVGSVEQWPVCTRRCALW